MARHTQSGDQDGSPVTVGSVIDSLPAGRFQRRLLLVTGGIWASVALSILVISFTIPVHVAVWGLSPVEAGILGSGTLFGMIFGASLGGRYSDRHGRKRTLVVAVALFTSCTALTGLATGLRSTILLRILTGIGVGASVTVTATYLSEHVPTQWRGRYLAYLEGFFALGNLATVLLAAAILPAGATDATVFGIAAWRVTFVAAGAPIVFVGLIHTQLSESPYYLARTGDRSGASDRLAAIAAENGHTFDIEPEQLAAGDPEKASFRRLFRPEFLGRTVLISVVWSGLNLGYYGVFIWLPDTVQAAGYVGGLYVYLTVVGVFQLLGVLTASTLVDRLGRKRVLAGSFSLSGLSTGLFTLALPGVDVGLGINGTVPLLSGLFATGFFIFASFAVIFGYTTELFPTGIRSSGLGFASGLGKIAAVAGPILAGWLVPFGYAVALAPFAVALLATGLLVGLFGPETMGETLE